MQAVFRVRMCLTAFIAGLCISFCLCAQDTRTVTEPEFPTTCAVVAAPLLSNSPVITGAGETVSQIDLESDAETTAIANALASCPQGEAVELSLGTSTSENAFLINPITIPSGVSLIVDGGVTVFGTLDVARYQVPTVSNSICGVPGGHAGGCFNLLTFSGNGGLYGYGVIDGRGNGALMCSSTTGSQDCSYAIGKNFWYLTDHYSSTTTSPCAPSACYTQNTPMLIADTGDDFTIYKITLRNSPYWHMNIVGNNVTIWGLKEQTTWAVVNTDGMDITGSNITVTDSTLSGGDDAVAIGAYSGPSSNITIDNLTLYSRNGLSTSTALEWGISNVLIENSDLTGDVPSLVGTTVNGVTQAQMANVNGVSTGIVSYTSALPASLGYTRGINIKNSANRAPQGANGNHVTNYQFSNICLQDLDHPITFGYGSPNSNGTYYYPTLTNIQYNNIHVLRPSAQFAGVGNGLYTPDFKGYPASTTTPNDIHLSNVVFDDLASGDSSIGLFYAWEDNFTNTGNVYPPALNKFSAPGGKDTGYAVGKLYLDLNDDNMLSLSDTTAATPALSCPAGAWPFLVGDLYISTGGANSSGSQTNLQSYSGPPSNSIYLNAVVSPATGHVTYFNDSAKALDTGAPALNNAVQFYEGKTLIGTASLNANGTLASIKLINVTAGSHTYTAEYPADAYYGDYRFGSVSVTITAIPAMITPTVTATPSLSSMTTAQTLSVAVTVSSGTGNPTPTGTVTLTGGGYTSSASTLTAGAASINIPANSLKVGGDTLTVAYTPDANSLSVYNSASGTALVTVTASASTSYSMTATPVTVTPGAATGNASTVTVSSTNGYAGTVILACSITSSPAGATDLPTCSVNPTTVTLDSSTTIGTATVTINTTAASTSALVKHRLDKGKGWGGAGEYVALGLFVFLGIQARRCRLLSMLGVLGVMMVVGGVVGCGGGGASGNTTPPAVNLGTTAGTYTVTVAGTGNDASKTTVTTTFTLTVK